VTTLVGTIALLGALGLLGVWLSGRLAVGRAAERLSLGLEWSGRSAGSTEATAVGGRGAERTSTVRSMLDRSLRRARVVLPVLLLGLALGRLVFDLPLPIALALSLDGAILTGLVLATRDDRRDLRLEEQLAEALRLTSAGLRAGLGRVEALHRAAIQLEEPLRPLLLETVGQLRLGEDPPQTFERFAQRVPLETFRLFTMVIATQWEAGGSLQNTFASVGGFMQDRVEVARRITAQAAPTRSAILTLFAATAAIAWFSWSNDPANLERFLRSDWGAGLVATALALQGLSLFWMWRLTRVRI